MINRYIILIILLYSTSINAQYWGDSLKAARSAFESENFELAYNKFLSAQRLAPDHIDLSKDIATSAYRAEDYKVAEQIFQGAISTDAVDANKKWLNVGNSQLKQKNLEGAIESYKNALRQNPNDDKARYNLAQAKRMQKQQEQQQEQNKKQQQEEQEKEEKNQDQSEGQEQENPENDSQDKNSQTEDQSNSKEENQSKSGDSDKTEKRDAQEAQEAKMTEKRIERMLDELLKEEMDTKHRVERKAINKGEGASTSGKKW